MEKWKKENSAARTTWLALWDLRQIPIDLLFEEAGAFKMDQLTFWAKSASTEMRQLQVRSIALAIDNNFRGRGAKFEQGVDSGKAIKDIESILFNEKKTIANLAENCDKNYLFWKENMPV